MDDPNLSSNLSYLVELVHNKFDNYMKGEVERWEAREAVYEKQELMRVRDTLINNEKNCRRIYKFSLALGILNVILYCHSSLGYLMGGLTVLLFLVWAAQLLTVRIMQRKALFYKSVVDNLMLSSNTESLAES